MASALPENLATLFSIPTVPTSVLDSVDSVTSRLIFFHVMGLLNFMTGLLTGVYAGIYASQNYNVPALPAPANIVERVKKFLDENKKE